MSKRERMDYDVVIVGAGPAGLSAAIRLRQLQPEARICVVEKAAQIGGHTLSGAVLDPSALTQLLPDWQTLSPPDFTPVSEDQFIYLSAKHAQRLPTPPPMKNHGNFIISLSQYCRWLGQQAETLGVEIYPGFAASELLYQDNQVIGIATGDMGRDQHGEPTARFQAGIELHAPTTLLAEGCRGSLSQQAIRQFELHKGATSPQTYALGIKEVWQIDRQRHHLGRVIHTVGWPLDHATYGGSFIYHLPNHQLAIGLVVGLDYQNPYLDPHAEMQTFKTHPLLQQLLTGGKRIHYGARALNEGGWQALPTLNFPGGALLGCAAGMVDVPKIKGIHNAIWSGMAAAETIAQNLKQPYLADYNQRVRQGPIGQALKKSRNIRPAFRIGLWPGLAYAAFDTYCLRGHAPWTWQYRNADHQHLQPAARVQRPSYPKPDGVLTFDKPSSVYLSNTAHQEDQPCHLKLNEPERATAINWTTYASPEQYYCPAGVYTITTNQHDGKQLQINASNCLHCKTCDIKDPTQNITWTPPQGGEGPNYEAL